MLKNFKNKIITIFKVIIISSLIFSHIGTILFKELNFYILPSRLWELLSGALYFFYEMKNSNNKKSKIENYFPFIGVLLITFSIFYFNDKVSHPSILTIIPVLGTILILNYAKKGELVTEILSSKIFVGFGLISYSLYLWHYPIFAFNRIHQFAFSIYEQIFLGLAIIFLSILTYFFIERPFRDKRFIKRKFFFLIISSVALFLVIISFKIVNTDGIKSRVPKIENYEFDNKLLTRLSITYTNENNKKKFLSKNKKILMIGDSNSMDLFNAFHLNRNLFFDKEFIHLGYDKNIYDNKHKELLNNSDTILFCFNWKNGSDLWGIIKKISYKNRKKIIIVLKRPEFTFLDIGMTPIDNYIFKNREKKINWDEINIIFSKKYHDWINENTKINKSLIMLSKKYDLNFLNPYEYTCNSEKKNL